jgi:2-methylcitrate dehydratase PrpD
VHGPAPAAAPNGITAQLVDWALDVRWDTIPDSARLAARRHLLDTLGCLVAGARQPLTEQVAAVIAQVRQEGEFVVPGRARRVDLLEAAYIAGVGAHGLELDDGYREGSTHPGAVVIPAALAAAQSVDADAEALLTSIVIGYEVMMAVARIAHPAMRRRGFHPTATSGLFGAAAAAAVLRKLDRTQMMNAFGIAASSASGLFAFVSGGADVKRLHPAHAAREGLFAVLLAQAGVDGPPNVLEGPDGFLQAYARREAADAPLLLPPDAGWGIGNCYLKPYPCCRHIHPAIDATLEIMRENGLSAQDIERVDVETYTIASEHAQVGWGDIASSQLSFPYVIATAASRGHVELADFDNAARADPATSALCQLITVRASSEMDQRYRTGRPATVTIEAGGRTFTADRDEALGSPQQPLDRAALERKFATLVDGVIGEAGRQALLKAIWNASGNTKVAALLAATVPALQGACES